MNFRVLTWSNLKRAVFRPFIFLPIPLALSLSVFATTYYMQGKTGLTFNHFYRDANAIAGQPFFYGFMEFCTSAMLLMSGAIALFCGVSLPLHSSKVRMMYVCLGFLTIMLGADDLFMIHENIHLLHPALSEHHVFLAYAAMLISIVIMFFDDLAETPIVLLFVAMLFFAVAAVEDMYVLRMLGKWPEDFYEVVAISFWSGYLASACYLAARVTPVRQSSRGRGPADEVPGR